MFIIIKDTDILRVGQNEYINIMEDEQIEIDNSMWEGKARYEIKWDGEKIINKTKTEIQLFFDKIKNDDIIRLKERIYLRQAINEDTTEFQQELDNLDS